MNAYPNDENYLQPSFGTPQETPSVDPDEGVLISVAYNPEWTKTLLGAVTQMRQYAAWAGTHDEKIETIERVNSLLFLLQNDITTVPAPFWDEDSADDSDDTAPINDQPWYGQIVIIDDRLTFVENAFIYVVAGFIVLSGLPTAAVAFVPIARNFVVTMRSNPLGGIVRFLADAVEIGRVDTYAAADAALDVPITMPAPTMGFVAEDVTTYPTLWVELLEDNPHDLPSVSMTLVRSRLSEADFSNPNFRYNPDTDSIEYTPDGGVTWNPSPGSDPRHSTAFLKPPVAGSSKQCDAAANMVKWLKDFIDQLIFDFELVWSVTTIINSILLELEILAPYFELLAIISELAETISGIGGAALTAAFTSDQYDLLECIFYCNCDSEGRVSADQLTRIETKVTAQLNTTAALVVNAILFVQGEIGLSNAGAVGSETGDCTGCDCGWCFNFHDGARLDEWISHDWGANGPATYSGGEWHGYPGATNTIWLSWDLTPTIFTDGALTITDFENLNRDIWINGDGTAFTGTLVWRNGSTVGSPYPVEVSRIDIIMVQAFNTAPRILAACQFSGSEDNPFGADNC